MSKETPGDRLPADESDDLIRRPLSPDVAANWLSAIVESADDAIISKTLEGVITSWNKGAERVFGYTAEEVIGKPVTILIPEDHLGEEPAILARIRGGERIEHYETVRVRKDGTRVDISLTVSPIRGPDGAVIGASKIARDITERRRTEEALRRREEELTDFIENSAVGLHWVGADGTIQWANRAELELLGYTREEYIGHHISEFHADPGVIEDILTRLKRDETLHSYEARLRCKDGSLKYVLISSNVRRQDGEFIHTRCFTRDITERKRAEAELQATEHRFTMFMENLPGLAWIKDLGGRYVYANEAATRAFGVTRAELYGSTDEDVFPPETAARFRENDLRALEGGAGVQTVEVLEQADGLHYSVVNKFPILGPGREQVMVGGVAVDITERMHAEEERERLLASEQKARAAAEEASRLKDEFLATVSHELRTPLTAIVGWAAMLRGNNLDERNTAKALETIERNARAQAQLIEDLMDVSRIITGKLRLDVRPVELVPIVEAAVDAVRPACEAKNIRLRTVLDPLAGPVSGDPARLQQVLWNLLSNAVKFTPKGGLVVVTLARINSRVEISVGDSGAGIPPEFLPHVFDRFRQADQRTVRQYGGLGLGLSIVRHLVELHGGSVRAESPGEGQGATFTVALPVAPVYRSVGVEPRVRATARDTPPSRECPDRLDGLRVLVVDDEPDTREMLKVGLEQCGAEVMTAASAGEALEALTKLVPDLLISDIGMPREDGYDLIRRVRRLPAESGGSVPAVALTAYARVEDRMQALRAGYQMHVPKPVELAELVAVAASLIRRRQ